MAPVESTSTVTVDTSWTTVHTVEASPKGTEKQDGLTLFMQNDDSGGTVNFRMQAQASSTGGQSRWLTLETFSARSDSDEPDAVVTDLEFSRYRIQAQATSSNRTVSAWHRFFSRESHAR